MNFDKDTIDAVAHFVDYMTDPRSALGLWIAASGLIAGAHLMRPFLSRL